MECPPAPLCPRSDFPLLEAHPEMVYWDSGATTQKPRQLIQALTHFYQHQNAPVNRSAYQLSYQLSQHYEQVRSRVARFCGWPNSQEVVFTHGCTEAINLVARQFLAPRLQRGKRVLLPISEHHANFIPWQRVCREKGAELRVLPLNSRGELELNVVEDELKQGAALLAVAHVSNVLGTIHPIAEITALAHRYEVPVLIDGAQAVGHLPLNLAQVDCDFYCFSTHKMYAADGCGILLARQQHLRQMAPLMEGGGAVEQFSPERTIYLYPPQRFEAGTMPVSAIVTLPVALDYLEHISLPRIAAYEDQLRRSCEDILQQEEALSIYGRAEHKTAIISFAVQGAHPHDIASVFDQYGFAIRAGHHCAQPLVRWLGHTALARISLGLYNQVDELARLSEALQTLRKVLL